jgi:hypothetical protein
VASLKLISHLMVDRTVNGGRSDVHTLRGKTLAKQFFAAAAPCDIGDLRESLSSDQLAEAQTL